MQTLLLRLDEARRQLQSFNLEANRFLNSGPYSMLQERDPDTGDYLLRIGPGADIPDSLNAIASHCIVEIRSTLDDMVRMLPGAHADAAEFAILASDPFPQSFREKAAGLDGIPIEAIHIVESLQPYKRTEDARNVNIPIGTLLNWLEQLSRWNAMGKPFGFAFVPRHVTFTVSNPGWQPGDTDFGPANDTHIFTRVRRVLSDYSETEIKAQLAGDVAFEQGPGFERRADVILMSLHDCVRNDVLPRFRRWL